MNVGKSLLFHRITGLNVLSFNYPGTTVELSEGVGKMEGKDASFFDLPGTYSLTGASEDEHIALDLLTKQRPDKVIVLANATAPPQSMILAMNLIELGYDVVLGLNFIDRARNRFKIDVKGIEEELGAPVIPIAAETGEGINRLLETLTLATKRTAPIPVRYGPELEESIQVVESEV